jgi:Caspase domain
VNEALVWTNPEWDGRDPGAFALVIGVSRYDHLPGGSGEPAQETYGLPQLHVCALTAYRFFRWLRESYQSDGVRLARCWLLLSPTAEELAVESDLADYQRPTFTACGHAAAEWFATMRDLAPESARQSRSLFFFTGHGLELHQGDQILLPCDYLEPPASVVNRALSTRNLRSGLAGLTVPVQLFFIDACRNDHSRFRDRGQQLRGTEVLNEEGAAWASPTVVSPIVYATTTGAQAFQPTNVDDELSIFGRALIEGLSEPPAEVRKCGELVCRIGLYELMGYLTRRVPELLADYRSTAAQPVSLGGQSQPITIAEVNATTNARPMPPSIAATNQRVLSLSANLPSTDWGYLAQSTQVLDVFGGGSMADFWAHHTLRAESGGAVRHELVSVARHELSAYRLVVRIPDATVPTVLRASDSCAELSCRLPALGQDVLLRLEASANDRGGWNISVGVDPSTSGIVGAAASAWLRYMEGDMSAVLNAADDLVQAVLAGRSASPIPALVAGLAGLRVNQDALLPWLDDIVLLYPTWPDFRILQCEQELRSDAARDLVARAAAALSVYTLPFTTEALGYAAEHAALVMRRPAAVSSVALDAARRIEEAVDALQPGGLFRVESHPYRLKSPSHSS